MEHGSERDFVLHGDELFVTRTLRPGFGARLQLREVTEATQRNDPMNASTIGWRPPAVAGAMILAGGTQVATSDADGLAELYLSKAPTRIEVRLAGWRVPDSWEFKDGRVLRFPAAEIWMVLE